MSLGMKKVKNFEKLKLVKSFNMTSLILWNEGNMFLKFKPIFEPFEGSKKKFKKEKKQVDSNPRPPARHPTPQPRRQPTLDFYSLAGE